MKGSKAVSFQEGEAIVNEGEKFQKVFQIVRGSCVVQRKVAGSDKVMTLSKMGVNGIQTISNGSFLKEKMRTEIRKFFTNNILKVFLSVPLPTLFKNEIL